MPGVIEVKSVLESLLLVSVARLSNRRGWVGRGLVGRGSWVVGPPYVVVGPPYIHVMYA